MSRRIRLVARTIFLEAIRRREIYVIVAVTLALLVAAAAVRFFDLEGVHKFYQEVALKAMSIAAAVTTVMLAARQLPREFERRTIYPLMARPISRLEFLAGKYAGVLAAGYFCLALFMGVFAVGSLVGGIPLAWPVFLQFVYCQALALGVVAALAFLLSMLMGLDAAVTTSLLLYLLGAVLTNSLIVLHDFVGAGGRVVLLALNWLVPQPALFDLSAKVIHGWAPVPAAVLALATAYAMMFIVPYLGASWLLFRRRAL